MPVLVVDFGTSSCRAATVTADGRVRSVSRVAHSVHASAGTVDVEAAWHSVLRAVIAEIDQETEELIAQITSRGW